MALSNSVRILSGMAKADSVALFLFLVFISGFTAALASAAGNAPPFNVNVINTSANPVPVTVQGSNSVTGSVTVTNTSANPVPVSGGVTINNTASAPVPVSGVVQHPFQASVLCGNTSSNGAATFCDGSFTAPASQSLIIEYVGVECGIDTGEGLRRALVNTVTTALADQNGVGSAGEHSLNILDHFGFANFVSMGQIVRFYADPASTISIEAQESGSHTNTFFCTFNLVGQAI